ncbi:MAG: zf-HC2 domain-containing protein [Gemmatimonadaceae bacterium]
MPIDAHVAPDLTAYCRGELGAEHAQRVAAHLLACPRCRRDYEEVRLGVALASRLPLERAPDGLWEGIAAGAARERAGEAPARAARRGMRWRVAVPALLAACAVGAFLLAAPPRTWTVARVTGAPVAAGVRMGGARSTARIGEGDWLRTDASSSARLAVGRIGTASIEPNTAVRLVRSRFNEQRLALAHGTIHAVVTAPPRLFTVETPAALAVDLGCAYTLEVDSVGTSVLRVTSGWVSLEREGRESIVAAGMLAEMRPGRGPGTPVRMDARDAVRRALREIDFMHASPAALDTLLAAATEPLDALTLWHLLPRVEGAERERVYARLAALAPPPEGVTQARALALERRALRRWRESLSPMWGEEAMSPLQRLARRVWDLVVAD